MPRSRPAYAPEFRQKLIELASAGRSPEELAKEFEPSAQTIRNWVKRADADGGKRRDVLTTVEREELVKLRRELRQVKLEREILAKANGLVRAGGRYDAQEVFRFVAAHQLEFPVRTMCRVFGVSPSGFYAWNAREPSARAIEDARLTDRVRFFHARSKGAYGAPNILEDLREEGIRVGKKRVARLMKADGLCGVCRRKFVITTARDANAQPSADLVQRQFSTDAPNRLWVADITYIPTWAGFLYLAVVLDVFSRRIVGWAMAEHLRTELVLAALNMAIGQRRAKGIVHHSDHGTQYTSIAFGLRCREANVRPSMGSVGDAYDNAMAESFVATLECELLDRRRFATKAEARMAILDFIEGWYNPRRRHSRLGWISPIEFERRHHSMHHEHAVTHWPARSVAFQAPRRAACG
ncbi:MAG TPA: IS3 family transposase [Burkholderiales bacterium]|nr:IS3 family transposase [Burkholderiales bacterium]